MAYDCPLGYLLSLVKSSTFFDEFEKYPLCYCSLVMGALCSLLKDSSSNIDLTLIDVCDEDGTPLQRKQREEQVSRSTLSCIPDSQIRIVCDGITWVDLADSRAGATNNAEYDINDWTILVETASLAILSLATNGRMTYQRIWRLLVHAGVRRLSDIDYSGDIVVCMSDEFPDITPGFSTDFVAEMVKLERLGDVELIRQAIIWVGKFWIWMRPDGFPPSETPYDYLTILEAPTAFRVPSRVEQLPLEILTEIASYCLLSSLLNLLSTSRHIRSRFLAHSSDRDALARTWIQRSAPWYLPVGDTKEGRRRIGWAYLRRCVNSPSMRNRKRIWGITEQLDMKADVMEI